MTIGPNPKTTCAIVVGVGSYALGDRWKLPRAPERAVEFTEWLRTAGVPETNISLFLSDADHQRFQTRLTSLGLKASAATDAVFNSFLRGDFQSRQGDLLYFFWIGHGNLSDEDHQILFFQDWNQTANDLHLNFSHFVRQMRATPYGSNFPLQIMYVDACANRFRDLHFKSSLGIRQPSVGEPAAVLQLQFRAADGGQVNSGKFSGHVLMALRQESAPESIWPPDHDRVVELVQSNYETSKGPVQHKWNTKRGNWETSEVAAPEQRESVDASALNEYLELLIRQTDKLLEQSVDSVLMLGINKLRLSRERVFKFAVSRAARESLDDEEDKPASSKPASTRIQETYGSFAEAFALCKRRAILLGKPGAGKTTTLLVVARDAANARLSDENAPIPILAQLQYWDYCTPLLDWAREQTNDPVALGIPENSILYLLDGLDERVPGGPFEKQEDAIRHFLSDLEDQLPAGSAAIVSCRPTVFLDAAKNRPSSLQVLELQDLSDEQIGTFLMERGQPGLKLALEAHRSLIELVRTPLMLAILSTAYSSKELRADEIEALTEAKIFDTYVHRRFVHELDKPQPLDFTEQQTRAYLGQLAVTMSRDNYLISSISKEEFQEAVGAENERVLSFARRMSLLWTDERNFVHFVHLSLQAYFAISPLIETLKAAKYSGDNSAIKLLRSMGRLAVPALVTLAKNGNPDARMNAVHALGLISDPSVIDELGRLAERDKNRRVRELAIRALIETVNNRGITSEMQDNQDLSNSIQTALRDTRLSVRIAASEALPYFATKSMVPFLLDRLSAREGYVVLGGIVRALGRLKDPRACPHLVRLIRRTRLAAWLSVPWRHVPILLLGTRIYQSTDPSLGLREVAMRALAQIGYSTPDAIESLIEFLGSNDVSPRIVSIESLGQLRSAAAVPILLPLLQSSDLRIRKVSAIALGQIGDAAAIDPLLRCLGDPDNLDEDTKERSERLEEMNVYHGLRVALGAFGADQILRIADTQIFSGLIENSHPLVRIDAVEILGWLGTETATNTDFRDQTIVPMIIGRLEDGDESVRLYATKELYKIGTAGALEEVKKRGLTRPFML